MTPKQTRILLGLGLLVTVGLIWFAPAEDSPSESAPVKAVRVLPGPQAGGRIGEELAVSAQGQTVAVVSPSQLSLKPQRPALTSADAEGLFGRQSWFRPPPPPPAPPPGPPPPPPVPQAPPLPYTYLGKYIEGSAELLILTRGNRVITASKGDVLDNQYRIERIDPSSVQFTYLPLGQPQTLATGSSQ